MRPARALSRHAHGTARIVSPNPYSYPPLAWQKWTNQSDRRRRPFLSSAREQSFVHMIRPRCPEDEKVHQRVRIAAGVHRAHEGAQLPHAACPRLMRENRLTFEAFRAFLFGCFPNPESVDNENRPFMGDYALKSRTREVPDFAFGGPTESHFSSVCLAFLYASLEKRLPEPGYCYLYAKLA